MAAIGCHFHTFLLDTERIYTEGMDMFAPFLYLFGLPANTRSELLLASPV